MTGGQAAIGVPDNRIVDALWQQAIQGGQIQREVIHIAITLAEAVRRQLGAIAVWAV